MMLSQAEQTQQAPSAAPSTKVEVVIDQGRSPEENDGSRDGSGDSSAMKRKYSDREPESPGTNNIEPSNAFGPSDPKKERSSYYETLDTDSPSSYPKHVIVPSSEKPMDEQQYSNVTNTPEDQRAPQPPDHGAQVLTPDSINRNRPAGGSYDSHQHYRQPYHDVYRTPSYNPEMDYGRGGSYGGLTAPPAAAGGEFTRQRRWACDICNVATFLSYEEACAHEEMCSRRFEGQPPYPDPRHPYGNVPPRGSGPPQGSGLGALYHASQEVVTPPTPHRHPQPRWGSSHGPHGPPLPVFPHEQHYYRPGPYDGRDEPHHYDPHGYPPHHPGHPSQPPPYYPSHPPHGYGPHDAYQKRMLLAMPSDRDSLSDRQCYVRSEMVEIFAATEKDVAARHSKGAQKLELGQVGIRCVHCSHLRPRDRAERAVCYPSSISRIYQTVADMQRFHFEQCREIPDHVRQVYKKLKTTRPRGVGSPQAYWMTSAKGLGLVDTESGIRFENDSPASKQEHISDMSIGTNN